MKDWKRIFKKGSKPYRFLELADPDNVGISRVVSVDEFIGANSDLRFGNGADWARGSSLIARTFNLEFIKADTVGHPTVALRLNGYREEVDKKTQSIRRDIVDAISKKRCVILGTTGSCNKGIQTDHKDGRKQNETVMNTMSQKLEDFQPLSMPANVAKRQFCKECKASNKRYDAKLLGYTVSFTEGDENYTQELGCVGCFWNDPIAFRAKLEFKK